MSRIVVAMSGGVDSSVAAALLREQGHDVIGVSLKLWDYDEEGRKLQGKTCCSIEDIADAKDVCDTLGIPFYAFNHKQAFQKHVIETFVAEYHRGRTPNPCILCNQFIKFDVLLHEARKLGADFLATGHYARLSRDEAGQVHLIKAVDRSKDQSYVLSHLRQAELRSILFPIGGFTKSEIRALAQKYGLCTSDKRESMDICFIPNNDHAAFIAKNYPQQKKGSGFFVDAQQRRLGEHTGIERYTIGQRRGLGVGFGERLYVSEIRPQSNEVVLAPAADLYSKGLIAERFNFIQPPQDKPYGAKLRYQKDEIPAEIVSYQAEGGHIEIRFLDKARAVSPGQALVLYDGEEVMGGGWISRSLDHATDCV